MPAFRTLALLAVVFSFDESLGYPAASKHRQEARPPCKGCGDECGNCEFGIAISTLCGIPECRRGPGDICGGPSEAWGVCGDGLACTCNVCTGCSLHSLKCHSNSCLPHQSLEFRHLDFFDRFPISK